MFQEVERTYRTALEEELTWNINFLRITIIILIISSGSLFMYFLLHSIFTTDPYRFFYGLIYFERSISSAFSNVFYGVSAVLQYPAILMIAIILIKITRNLTEENKRKLNIIAILFLSILGINLIFTVIRGIFYVYTYYTTKAYDIFNIISYYFTFYSDYLIITIAVIILSLTLNGFKKFQGNTENIIITPFIQGITFAIWFICTIIYQILIRIDYPNGVKLSVTTVVFSCLFAASMTATFAELLVNIGKINIPQIIATKEN